MKFSPQVIVPSDVRGVPFSRVLMTELKNRLMFRGGLKKKSPISQESSPIDAWIFWSKREFLFAPRFMTDRTAKDPLIEL
jgi:hypothetical protein